MSVPVYWMGFMTLTLFAPGTGYLLRIPILSDSDIGQFLGELGHAPGLDVIHLLVFEAAAIIAVAIVLCDLAQAWLAPRLRRSA